MQSSAALLAALTGMTTACVSIDGGAIEVGWEIRGPEGSVPCDEAGIARVRLRIDRAGDDGANSSDRLDGFRCGDGLRGSVTTDFDECAPAATSLSIEALDAGGGHDWPDRGVRSAADRARGQGRRGDGSRRHADRARMLRSLGTLATVLAGCLGGRADGTLDIAFTIDGVASPGAARSTAPRGRTC